jgi:hypothetical protein
MLLLALLLHTAADSFDRLPEPGAEEQAASNAAVRDAFRDRYGRPALSERQALARDLLEEAQDATNTADTVFALLKEAGEVAAAAGDAGTAAAAADRLGETFDVDAVGTKGEWLFTAVHVTRKDPGRAKQAAAALLGLVDQAVAGGNYELAVKAAGSAVSCAQGAGDVALAKRARAKAAEAREVLAQSAKAAEAMAVLVKRPDDPQANATVGWFVCFLKGDWDNGLPYLAKAPDKQVRAAAELELQDPDDPAKWAAIGDAWLQVARQLRPHAAGIEAHARRWFEQAHPHLEGLERTKVARRIDGIIDRKVERAGEPAVDLTALQPLSAKVGWGRFEVNSAKSAPKPPRLGGQVPPKYLLAAAPSCVAYVVEGMEGRRFHATGLINHEGTDGVYFVARVDGTEVFRSKLAEIDQPVRVEVRLPPNSRVLELVVDENQNQTSDHAFWVSPAIK